MKRILAILILLAVCATMFVALPAEAATSLPNSIYLYPTMGGPTCTLVSAAMMHRARMYLSGDTLWNSVTEYSIYDIAWINGVGLRGGWTYNVNGNSMTVARAGVSGISIASLKAVLNAHPEGVVLYSGTLYHAVFLTDYEGDTFYCADPYGGNYSGKRMTLASSYLGALAGGSQANVLGNVTAYWYISAYNFPNVNKADLGTDFSAVIFNKAAWMPIENCHYEGEKPPVRLSNENSCANQQWRFFRQSDGSYKIASCYDGKYLDVRDANTGSGAVIQTCVDTGHDAQKWFLYEENGGYRIISKLSGYALDLVNNNAIAGNTLQTYAYNGSGAQIWSIYRGEDRSLSGPTMTVTPGTESKDTVFTWGDVYGEKQYNLWIWKDYWDDSNPDYSITDAKSGATMVLPAGDYQAFVMAENRFQGYAGNMVTFTVESDCTHSYGAWITVTPATCTADGLQKQTCTKCGLSKEQTVKATGHAYEITNTVPATCLDTVQNTYTCSNCGDYYARKSVVSWSEWTEEAPTDVAQKWIRSKLEYRYSDREKNWAETECGTIDYVSSWPSGFATSSSYYTQYNNTPKIASTTQTERITVNSNEIVGYLYYHWCRGYAYGPINRRISEQYDVTYCNFHAFYSTDAGSDYDANGAYGEGAKYVHNAACCKDSYWYIQIPVYRQSYTVETLQFSGERWTEWSAWSVEKVEPTEDRRVETRTIYQYAVDGLGEHTWDSGVVVKEPTASSDGERQYTCQVCAITKTEKIPYQQGDVFGDLNGDKWVNNDDVVLLLWNTLFPEDYPLNVSGDMDRNGKVNNEDVVLLLWHTLFPEEYPLI